MFKKNFVFVIVLTAFSTTLHTMDNEDSNDDPIDLTLAADTPINRNSAAGLLCVAEQIPLYNDAPFINPVELYQEPAFFDIIPIAPHLPTTGDPAHIALSRDARHVGFVREKRAYILTPTPTQRQIRFSDEQIPFFDVYERTTCKDPIIGIFWHDFDRAFVLLTEKNGAYQIQAEWNDSYRNPETGRMQLQFRDVNEQYTKYTITKQTSFHPYAPWCATIYYDQEKQHEELRFIHTISDEIREKYPLKGIKTLINNCIKWRIDNATITDSTHLRVDEAKGKMPFYDVDYGGTHLFLATAHSLIEEDQQTQNHTRTEHKLWDANDGMQCEAFLYASKHAALLKVTTKPEESPRSYTVMLYNFKNKKLRALHTEPTNIFAIDHNSASFIAGNKLYRPKKAIVNRICNSTAYARDIAQYLYPEHT